MELENFGCVAMDATEITEVDGGSKLGDAIIGLGVGVIGSGIVIIIIEILT